MTEDAKKAAPDSKVEGWTWTQGGRKWHYYRDGRSICGGMMLFAHPREGYELGDDDSPDNCAACQRKLRAALASADPLDRAIDQRRPG